MKLSNLRAEMEGREQSMYALQVDYILINAKQISYTNSSLNIILIDEHKNIDQTQALKAVVPGFEKAKLRNFGMTIGNKDVWLEFVTNIGMNDNYEGKFKKELTVMC